MDIGEQTKTVTVAADHLIVWEGDKSLQLRASKDDMIWAWCVNGDSGPHGILLPMSEVVDAIDALVTKAFKKKARRK